ncbi:MAG: VIT domain-containing protein [Cyanobacteria bacterium P01_F01_bin.150]
MRERLTTGTIFLGTATIGAAIVVLGSLFSQSQAQSLFQPHELSQKSRSQKTLVQGTQAPKILAQAAPESLTQTILGQQSSSASIDAETDTESVTSGLLFSSPQQTDGLDDATQAFPLKHTDVNATIQGNVARVEVTQTFENPFDESLEAVYVFPLPDKAAVDDMEIRVGDRVISGDIKKREEAQEIYEQAVQAGRTAGLLEQERANIFTQSLANIRPGEQIEVTIRYTESLTFEGNNYEFVFPMVVGPRYIPGVPTNENGDTDQVSDGSRITPPVLKPGTRSGHDIAVAVNFDAGMPIQSIASPSHKLEITSLNSSLVGGETDGETDPPPAPSPLQGEGRGEVEREGRRGVQVNLAPNDTIPNKDLILRYQISGDETQTTLLTDTTEEGGHFALYLVPAVEYDREQIVPKDVVFLMDTSGSQSGDPIAKSQELMRRMVNGLNPDDTFSIIDFANTTTRLSDEPLANTTQNRSRAIDYINGLNANGGTELLNGMREVLNFPAARPDRLRSIVLLTDGYIGNEAEVIAEVQAELAPGNRLYSFGVGSGVNRFLIDRLAEVGRGTSQVIRQDEPSGPVAEQFFQQINNPVLTNIEVEWIGNGEGPEIYPGAAPDLFTQQPLVIFGRKADGISGTLKVTGTMVGGKRYEKTIPVNFTQGDGSGAIAQLWGRSRIKDLMNQMYRGETVSGVEGITETALAYRLLSQYTAFVAVSEEVRVNPDGTRRTVEVPVELPEGVSYEGIFGLDDASPGGVGRFAPSPVASPRSRRAAGATRGNIQSLALPSAVNVPHNAPAPATGLIMSSEEAEALDELNNSSRSIQDIRVIQIDGALTPSLQSELKETLDQHLAYFSTASDQSGEVVWQVRVRNGRVMQVLWDDRLSTMDDQAVIDGLRRSLQSWQLSTDPFSALSGTFRITMEL